MKNKKMNKIERLIREHSPRGVEWTSKKNFKDTEC